MSVLDRPGGGVLAPEASEPRRAALWLAGGLLLVHAVLAWVARWPGIASGQDDAWYFLLSRALLRLTYEDFFVLGSPTHHLYPPGYPALLAIWSPFGGLHHDWLVVLNILFSTAALALTFDGVRRALGVPTALLSLAVLAVNPELLARAGKIAAEPAFTFFVVLTLWLAQRNPRGPALPVALAALAAAMVRSVGVALLAALMLHWALQRRWKAVGVMAFVAAVAGAWIALTALAPDKVMGRSYIADLVARRGIEARGPVYLVARRLVTGLYYYPSVAFPWALRVPTVAGTVIDNIVILGTNLAGLGAGIALLYRRWRPAALYVLATGALLIMWVWRLDRFLIPLLPVLVPALLAGIAWWAGRVRPSWAVPAALAVSAILVAGGLRAHAHEIALRAGCGRTPQGWPAPQCQTERERDFFKAVAWAGESLPDDAIVYVAKTATFHLYTGLMTAPTSSVAVLPIDQRLAYLRELGVGYMLVSRSNIADRNTFMPLAEAECENLTVAAAWDEAVVLRIPPESAVAGGACDVVARLRAALDAARDVE